MGRSAQLGSDALPGGVISPLEPSEFGVILVRKGEITWASERGAELLGRDGDLIGESFRSLFGAVANGPLRSCDDQRVAPPEGDAEHLVCRVSAHFEGHLELSPESQYQVWILQETGYRERRRSQEARCESSSPAVKVAERVQDRRRDEWMALVSHELRTPLTVIAGYNKLLLSGETGKLSALSEE